MMSYPGDRVTVSTLMLHWVWQHDINGILKYLHEEDPHGDRKIAERVRDTLDCVRHYRDRSRRQFLTRRERRRYDEFNRIYKGRRIAGQPIISDEENNGVEFIADHRMVQ